MLVFVIITFLLLCIPLSSIKLVLLFCFAELGAAAVNNAAADSFSSIIASVAVVVASARCNLEVTFGAAKSKQQSAICIHQLTGARNPSRRVTADAVTNRADAVAHRSYWHRLCVHLRASL